MMKKAKTYLASIQTATTERELTGIEIKFKQDVSIDWDDISKLCRAADDRRYILRNKVDTIQLKEILFKRTGAEMDALSRHEPQAGKLVGRGNREAADSLLCSLAGY